MLLPPTHNVCFVGWAKRSVPTIFVPVTGGHGANAPLPTLRQRDFVVWLVKKQMALPTEAGKVNQIKGLSNRLGKKNFIVLQGFSRALPKRTVPAQPPIRAPSRRECCHSIQLIGVQPGSSRHQTRELLRQSAVPTQEQHEASSRDQTQQFGAPKYT